MTERPVTMPASAMVLVLLMTLGEGSSGLLHAQCSLWQLTVTGAGEQNSVKALSDNGAFALVQSTAPLHGGSDPGIGLFRLSIGTGAATLIANTMLGGFGSASMSASGDEFAYLQQYSTGRSAIFYQDLSDDEIEALSDPDLIASYFDPAVSPDGDWLAFSSNDNLLANPDQSREVYLLQVSSGDLSQLTSTGAGGVSVPFGISLGGDIVAYYSNQTSPANADGSFEVWVDELGTGYQLTQGPTSATITPGDLSLDGTQVYFTSSANYVGQNGDLSQEIFLFDPDVGLVQFTASSGGTEATPQVDDSGRFVAWRSNVDYFGESTPPDFAGFIFDRLSGGFSQLAHLRPGKSIGTVRVASNGLVAFDSTEDPLGLNADLGSEVFLVTCAHQLIFQDGFDRGSDSGW